MYQQLIYVRGCKKDYLHLICKELFFLILVVCYYVILYL
jgi:hypothetical protein